MDLTTLTLTDAARRIASGDLSPVDLVQAYLQRIEELEPVLNCFITYTPEEALREAKAAEQAVQQGQATGPLHGIPLALKDLFDTRGVRTTAGSKFFSENVPDGDAYVVQKLRQAGAVILGKLNMHEIALGVTTNNPHFGLTRNPWDTERVPGGSSGGSGAALAARLCLGSLGSDTGGSIRIPASLCGVVGLKPTYGRASLRGVVPLSWNLDHAGPMARNVKDAAELLQVIAGYDPEDPVSVDRPVGEYTLKIEDGVKGWKVGLITGEYVAKADPEVLAAVEAAAGVFARLGAEVQRVELPGMHQAASANGMITPSDAAAFHRERLQARPEDFGEDVLRRLKYGAEVTSSDYILARRTQVVLRRQWEMFFEKFDVLLLPATPITAPLAKGDDAVEQARLLTRFTAPFNLTGFPALVLPCGLTPSGLPIGLQIVAHHWAEPALLRAAYAYEQAVNFKAEPSAMST